MGLPEILIDFKRKASSVINRSAMGIVALILKDDTGTFNAKEYAPSDTINASDWTPENKDYIEKALLGSPNKVIVERIATTATDYNEALTRLINKRWNYLAIPGIEAIETSVIATWIEARRDTNKKTFKAVLPNEAADHEGIVNFTTTNIVVGEKTYSTAEYTSRIAGALAGLPFTRSATYLVLPEVTSITEHEDPDIDIDSGELILVNDGTSIKIGRGVNSLVTIPTNATSGTIEKTEDFKKIKVVEIMDMIQVDITDTFNQNYVGKVPNTYDNQVLFFNSVNTYFDTLEDDELLDPSYDNRSEVDVVAQRAAWEESGVDTSSLSDQEIKEMSFKSNVFAGGNIKIVDAMEDLGFQIYM
ncbi:phage tail sheath C-terminal domain-containing protein [Metabacillus litoralis]|uniref:phage tail sheath C-terminal domain-containing protein n=1 Tax=Metabacillus litoralis TaxID=152268 RepID=UPI00203B7388|nr:phage tail sheath C-terminal domain-containing protein [Metabacillus litoralis]MCM3411463.1 phage tail sheath subtilisin-like domain-containing protein [Metabacillus litoralis]